jgi:hypothetical protein
MNVVLTQSGGGEELFLNVKTHGRLKLNHCPKLQKTPKNPMSFRPKGEILLEPLTFDVAQWSPSFLN